jgi:SAM-dependent methyltransferase
VSYSQEYYQNRDRYPMWRVEARIARDLVGPAVDGVVVDLGCGSGELLRVIRPKMGIGIDLNQQAIQLAQADDGGYDFRIGDAAEPGLPDESVDCIVHMHLFEHLSEPKTALRSWHRALKPRGRLVILTPNGDFSHPEEFDDPDHKHLYRGPELAALLEQNGFLVGRIFTAGLWGMRRWPFFWRYQWLCERVRLPNCPGLRWQGQTLSLSATKQTL